MTILHIKNMVCDRCISTVKSELEKLGYVPEEVTLGKAVLKEEPDEEGREKIAVVLEASGFELIRDKDHQITEQIKNLIVKMVHYDPEALGRLNYSDYLEKETGIPYKKLSSLFSGIELLTIEKYIILQRVELVKELISYNEDTFSEIAWKTGYSSVHHLSSQFKSITGLTPSAFRKLAGKKRKSLDEI